MLESAQQAMTSISDESLHSLGSIAASSLSRLCRATGRAELIDHALRVCEAMSRSWAARSVAAPAWPSDLTDDGTPFEFSLGFEHGRPDVRMLVEAQGALPTAHEQWKAGKELSAELSYRYGASCRDLFRLADLFEPASNSRLHFGLWHGVTFRSPSEASDFKAYLNPLVLGRGEAFRLVDEALLRIGLAESAAFLRRAQQLCEGRAWPVYFCLDLIANQGARAKVYLTHADGGSRDASALLELCPNLIAGDVSRWCNTITGGVTHFDRRPLLSCFSFTKRDQRPCGTLHIPARCYVPNDQILLERIIAMMDDLSAELYRSAVRSQVTRPLSSASGFQTYVSLRRVKGAPRMTLYLAPELYAGRSS